jgi:hypothetical protein
MIPSARFKPLDTLYHNVVYLVKIFFFFLARRIGHGQSRVLLISPETPKDAERNGRAFGNFS